MNLDPNDNLTVNETITSSTITDIKTSLDSKAPLSHIRSINDVFKQHFIEPF